MNIKLSKSFNFRRVNNTEILSNEKNEMMNQCLDKLKSINEMFDNLDKCKLPVHLTRLYFY